MTTTEPDLYYDPYDFEIDTDPYPIWKRLRDEALPKTPSGKIQRFVIRDERRRELAS